jgi:hypothetical protein
MPFRGWDFEALGDRWQRGDPDWNLKKILRERLRTVSSFLDLGTGGGEFLSTLAPFPRRTFATEGYEPNIPVARSRLGPLGVKVLSIASDNRINLPSESIELVLSRHEAFDASEVARVLVSQGMFVTQQVGGRNYEELHRRFGAVPEPGVNRVDTLAHLAEEISSAGLVVEAAKESVFPERFLDVGAVVCFLRAAPWEVPGFSVPRYRAVLQEIHSEISRQGYWELLAHRLLVVARKTATPTRGK